LLKAILGMALTPPPLPPPKKIANTWNYVNPSFLSAKLRNFSTNFHTSLFAIILLFCGDTYGKKCETGRTRPTALGRTN
jgi:hypothetical protein